MQNQDAFNPFQNYTPFHPNPQESPFPQHPQEPFTHRSYRASQDSNASTIMHTDASRRSGDDRPSMESIRSGFGSPPSPSAFNANSASRGDSLFAFASSGNHQQQQAAQNGLGGMQAPLGSGRGLETMLEDEDPRVRPAVCLLLDPAYAQATWNSQSMVLHGR